MQTTDAQTVTQPDWPLGLRALLIAMALVGVANMSGNHVPFAGAALVAGWAALKPLRLWSIVWSRRSLVLARTLGARAAALLAAGLVLSIAVNSQISVVAALGNMLFAVLVLVVACLTAWNGWRLVSDLAPRAWARSAEGATYAWSHAAAVWGAMTSR